MSEHRSDHLPVLQRSGTFSPEVMDDIHAKAELGRYRIRGFGTLRERRWPTFDDLTFLPCTLTRIPLEGYREKCSTQTVLGTRFARKPIRLDIPIMITGMSWGALSFNAKVALAKGAARVGSSNTTGDGGIELTVGQGAKPGTGGLLLGSKVSATIAQQRDLPVGVDQRSPARHPDFLGPDDLIIKIEELREATDGQVPIFVKMGATRTFDDVKLAAKAGADVIVVDGMEGGTGASPEILQEHTGIPTLAAVCEARMALEDLGLYGQVQLIIAGGIRNGVDAAKALALGADAIYIGTAALIALNCNKPLYVEDYRNLGTEPYHCHHCHTGRCPVGITTQDPELVKRLPVDEAAERVSNLLQAMTLETQVLARACGKADVHDLEPEDMRALTLEASMICGIPLVGTRQVFGGGPGWRREESS